MKKIFNCALAIMICSVGMASACLNYDNMVDVPFYLWDQTKGIGLILSTDVVSDSDHTIEPLLTTTNSSEALQVMFLSSGHLVTIAD